MTQNNDEQKSNRGSLLLQKKPVLMKVLPHHVPNSVSVVHVRRGLLVY